MASSHLSSMLCCHERNEHEVLRCNYKMEEAKRITIRLKCNNLAQQLAQLQRKFDEFYHTTIPYPPKTRSLGPILQEAQPLTQPKTHPSPTLLPGLSNHIGPSHCTKVIMPIPTLFLPFLVVTLPPPTPYPQ